MHKYCLVLSLSILFSAGLQASKTWDGNSYNKNSVSQELAAHKMLEGYEFSGSEKVLDVGCGDGKITANIAKSVPKGAVVGVDISPSMIGFANEHFGKGKTANLSFQIEDAAKLQMLNQFDIVVSFSAMQWVIDQQGALKRIFAALKPNGKILISMPAGYPEALANALTGITADEKWKAYFVDFKLAQVFFKQDEYTTLLEKSGFQDIDVKVIPMFDDFASVQAFSNFVRQWLPHLQAIPNDQRDAFMAELMSRYTVSVPANDKGGIRFPKYTLQARAQKGDENKKEL